MTTAPPIDLAQLAKDVELPLSKTQCALELLDEGNTVAFITRYRKDQTGGLDEEQIRRIESAAVKSRQLAERKEAIRKSIESQNKLTPELAQQIERASSQKQLEDLYLPYKPHKQTLATLARQRGLEPLAHEILQADPAASERLERARAFVDASAELATVDAVLQGVGHILAERYSERADLRSRLRGVLQKTGQLKSSRNESAAKAPVAEEANVAAVSTPDTSSGDTREAKASQSGAATPPTKPKKKRKADRAEAAFRDYFEYCEAINRIPPHRVLAINRGEREKVLRVRVEGDTEQMTKAAADLLKLAEHHHADFLRDCLSDALDRLIVPSLERELRRELTEKAEEHAVRVFARNLRNLLLQPPVRGRRVLAIDPGFRSGCKLAVLDAFGNLVENDVIYIVGRDETRQAGRQKLVELIRKHALNVVAIGNGTACRETEQVVASVIGGELSTAEVAYVIVNEAGASVYSTSALGREELPDSDPVVRSAVSIGRRLLDPLSELVKITPANIGVGMYQHDVKSRHLRESLDAVVESCVNFVGVDLNASSPALLSYLSGLNQLTARRVYEHRCTNGPFRSREQLREVPGIGDATYIQAAGFLKIADSDNPLDATSIHPESYDVARRLLERFDSSVDELSSWLSQTKADTQSADNAQLLNKVAGVDIATLSQELGVGEMLVADLLAALKHPGRDPRDDLSPPMFRTGIVRLEDLKVGMELRGTVLNVVDFGAFVDIGISDSALIHISRLANRFVRDPHTLVSVGDVLPVWVVDVDKERRRVSLSAVSPDVFLEKRTPRSTGDAGSNQTGTAGNSETHQPKTAPRKRPGPRAPKFRSKPAPKQPITDEMAKGTEPMRSFSDLIQFYEQKRPSDEDASDNDGR
jgi:uncharacterized protein